MYNGCPRGKEYFIAQREECCTEYTYDTKAEKKLLPFFVLYKVKYGRE
tara:strand:- start:202 stop:345 length:144 start_codon:yes stop_codon:yes gene_type:complete